MERYKEGKRKIVFCTMILCTALAGGCAGKPDVESRMSGQLPQIIIGSDNYPPYNYEDADGRPTGIDVDLATEAFRRMGYEAVFSYINSFFWY